MIADIANLSVNGKEIGYTYTPPKVRAVLMPNIYIKVNLSFRNR